MPRVPAILTICTLLAACMSHVSDTSQATAERLGVTLADVHLLKDKKHLSDADLLAMPRQMLDQTLQRLQGVQPDQPEEAEAWRALTLRDERGQIPHNALLAAKAQMEQLRAANPLGVAGGLSSANWTELGPSNIGGRTRALAPHPTIAGTVFAGSVSGGIWKSTNSGSTWTRMNSSLTNIAVVSIVYQPGNPNVMYAGTGETFTSNGIRGAGIFKSVDGGTTWAQLAATNTSKFYWVSKLAFAPNGTALLAATQSGIFRSTDGGLTWPQVYTGTGNAGALDVDFHPTNNNIAVACLTDYDFTLSTWFTTAIYSTNGGVTWADSTGGVRTNGYGDRVELVFHRGWTGAGNGCVYAQKYVSPNTLLYRSTNGGASYTLVSTSTVLSTQGGYDNAIWVDPSDVDNNSANDVLVCGGVDLYRSIDGGVTFTKISEWFNWPTSAHADHHAIVEALGFNGVTNRTVYFGNDGGVWRTDDVYAVAPLTGWVNLNNGYAVTQFYGGARYANTDIVVGGTQDNGSLRTSGGATAWTTMFGGDGGFAASDPTNGSYHYGEYVYLKIHRSTNGGTSSSYIYTGIGDAGLSGNANFIAPFVLDPNNANTMLAGGLSLWRSNDVKAATPSWSSIKPSVGSVISAIAVAPGNSNLIWVGHNNGDVYFTTNGTAAAPTWVRRDNQTPALPDRYVTRITIDPKNTARVFVTFGGFATDNIWRTTNSGANWGPLTGLPSAPVRDVEVHELYSNWLYAATEVGLLVSENDGVSWTSTATPEFVSIDELFWSSHKLYLVTFGRGMFSQLALPQASAAVAGLPCRLNGPQTGPSLTSGVPVLGTNLTFSMTNSPTPGTAALYVSNVPAAPIQISPGCFIQLDLAIVVNIGTQPVSGTGTATWNLPLPDVALYAGIPLMTQAAVISGGFAYFSNGRWLYLGY